MGFNHTKIKNSTLHTTKLTQKAKLNLGKLFRFKHAPPHIKLQLYKSLISPLLEYPPIITATISDTQMKKLQTIQNSALRFIYNTHYTDYTTNDTLHRRAGLATVKERLTKLRIRALENINNLINSEDGNAIYKFSDFTLNTEPFNPPSNKLKNMYTKLGLLDDNNELNINPAT